VLQNQPNIEKEVRIETVERQECVVFIDAIKKDTIDTFPFLSEEERDTFSKKLDLLSENNEVISSPVILIGRLRSIIATLNNSHTKLEEDVKEKQYWLENPIRYKAGTFWVDIESGTFEVVSLNGVSITNLVTEKRKEIGGGTDDWQINLALGAIMTSKNESGVTVEIKNKNGKTRFPAVSAAGTL